MTEAICNACGKVNRASLVVCLCLTPVMVSAQVPGTCSPAVGEAYLDIGNVRARIPNNGNLFWRSDPHVYEVPKGGGIHSIFSSSIWIGGLVDGDLRAAATRYGPYEFWSGPLNDDGSAPDDCGLFDRVWKVNRSDVETFEVSGTAAVDLSEWPTGLGAPTLSPLNADGSRTSLDGADNDDDGEVDEPGELRSITAEVLQLPLAERINRTIDLASGERPEILGDQMLWWIMNDVGNVHQQTQTDPIGLEVHASAFAFARVGDLGNTTFYRYKIHNKAQEPLLEAYFGLFSDFDLGNFDDDYVGSDPELGLGIGFNADNMDEGSRGYGLAPPAFAYDFLQGPIVSSPLDTARAFGRPLPGFRNRGMTSFMAIFGSAGPNGDPSIGADYYGYMQSIWKDGTPATRGDDGGTPGNPRTYFMYPDDASKHEFWSELNVDNRGTPSSPADRRFCMSSGPFDIPPGDSQDIVVGIVWARGLDNLDSYVKVKQADRKIQNYFDAGFREGTPPDPPEVVAAESDRSVKLTWSNSEGSNNVLNSYHEAAPLGDPDYPFYDLEGYELWQFDSANSAWPSCLDQNHCRMIDVFDIPNNVRRVIADPDADGFTTLYAEGNDSGIRNEVERTGLTNFTTYYYGVRAYAYNRLADKPVIRSDFSRVEVTPSRQPSDPVSGTPLLTLDDIGIVPNPYKGASSYETSRLDDRVRFTNLPDEATIRIFTLSGKHVRTLQKQTVHQTWLDWDVRSTAGRRLASGIYLVNVDVPGVGSRVIKFGLVGGR